MEVIDHSKPLKNEDRNPQNMTGQNSVITPKTSKARYSTVSENSPYNHRRGGGASGAISPKHPAKAKARTLQNPPAQQSKRGTVKCSNSLLGV